MSPKTKRPGFLKKLTRGAAAKVDSDNASSALLSDEVEIITAVAPDVAITRSLGDILNVMDTNQEAMLREISSLRRFILECFSSLVLELNELPPNDTSTPPKDKLKRFLSRLGGYCDCLSPTNPPVL